MVAQVGFGEPKTSRLRQHDQHLMLANNQTFKTRYFLDFGAQDSENGSWNKEFVFN